MKVSSIGTDIGCYPRRSQENDVSWKPEVIAIAPQPVSKELKKRWSYFIRKVYETDPLTCPKCQGEIRIISFIDQSKVIKKILQHLGLWEESHAPPDRNQKEKEINFDASYSQALHTPSWRKCPVLSGNCRRVDITLPYRIFSCPKR